MLNLINSNKPLIGAAVAAVPIVYTAAVKLFVSYQNRRHRLLGEEIRAVRDSEAAKFLEEYSSQISEERMEHIISFGMVELSKEIKAMRISCFEAVLTYCIRAASIGVENKWVGYIDQAFLAQAINKAKSYDELLKEGDESKIPPFIGVPVSIKDSIGCKGLVTSYGIVKNYCKSKEIGGEEDSEMIAFLREQGFIPICQSTGPQSFLTPDSASNVWGACYSSWKKGKSSGGSSSGEGGLIGSKCSVIGIGSDIGGSLRIPSVFNGIYSLKPSVDRLPQEGRYNISLGRYQAITSVRSTLGPMCRNMDDLVEFYRFTAGKVLKDDRQMKIEFREEQFSSTKKLKIAKLPQLFDLGISKANKNVFDEVLAKLGEKHEIVELPLDICEDLYAAFLKSVIAGMMYEGIAAYMFPEPMNSQFDFFKWLIYIPNFVRNMYFRLMKWRSPRMNKLWNVSMNYDRIGHLKSIGEVEKAKFDFTNYLKENNIDIVINPSAYIPCFEQGKNTMIASYHCLMTLLFNQTDLPAGVVPIRLVKEGENEYVDKHNDYVTKLMKEECSDSVGMPVGVHVAGRYAKEETVLRMMKEIDDEFKFTAKYSPAI